MQLAKATIGELTGKNETRDNFDVQFNPASLRLQITNSIEGGESRGRQVRQYLGSSSSTLTCDLIFDTADDGQTEKPVSVRTKTAMLERFLQPKGNTGKKYVTPRVRFHWGDLTFDGVVDNLSIDMAHFAADGTPLRAKVSLAIKEQNPELELNKSGPGANAGSPAPKAGQPAASSAGFGVGARFGVGGGIGLGLGGGIGLGVSANVDLALGGESAANFAARAGLDPAAWRALQLGAQSSLSLSAGVEVGFDAEMSTGAGLGVMLGAEAGAAVSVEASFGLQADGKLDAVGGVGVGTALAAGFALSAAGGVTAAIESVQNARNVAAEQQARIAFKLPEQALPAAGRTGSRDAGAPVGPIEAQPRPPGQVRTPLKTTGLPSPATPPAPPVPSPPMADERASSFGFGVALRRRQTVAAAADQRAAVIYGSAQIKSKVPSGDPPVTEDPTTPAWVALPARVTQPTWATHAPRRIRPGSRCRCAH